MAPAKAALRLLARERPDIPAALVRELTEGVLDSTATVELEVIADAPIAGHLTVDADFVACVGANELLHLEFQDCPDSGSIARLFRQHLSLALGYPLRRVTTVAFWLLRPPHANRVEVIRWGRILVHVVSVVLADVRASRLLANPPTACFAAGADSEGWSDEELCTLVAQALKHDRAKPSAINAAIMLATARGRYRAMVRALGASGIALRGL
jgi:hypothetical protein